MTTPLTSPEAWKETCDSCLELQLVRLALASNEEVAISQYQDLVYHNLIVQGLIVEDIGGVFKWEKPLCLRKSQVRTSVVPWGLRQVAISACHSSPLSRYMEMEKTLCCMALRFW